MFRYNLKFQTVNNIAQNNLVDCKESETVDEEVAEDIQAQMSNIVNNLGFSDGGASDGEGDGEDSESNDGLVSNFNSLTSEELA